MLSATQAQQEAERWLDYALDRRAGAPSTQISVLVGIGYAIIAHGLLTQSDSDGVANAIQSATAEIGSIATAIQDFGSDLTRHLRP